MLSTIPLASRQAKKLSRARQQWVRDCRFGASKAPSGEGAGFVCVGGGSGEVVNRPIVFVVLRGEVWGLLVRAGRTEKGIFGQAIKLEASGL